MSAEARFQYVAGQIRDLVGCDSVHLLLSCPEPELRHPLLKLTPGYCSAGSSGSPDHIALIQDERVRALCDEAIQTGQVKSINLFQMSAHDAPLTGCNEVQSIAVAPIERPAGTLGLLLLSDPHPDAFYPGERLLLRHYLPQVARNLEEDLRNMSALPFHANFIRGVGGTFQHAATGVQLFERPPEGGQEPVDQQMKELDRLKNEFISMVSHELRTPLTSIKGYAVLLQAYGLTEHPHKSDMAEMSPARQRQYLDMIMEQTSHLEVLISDLLDISRIHAGRLSLRHSQVDVIPLCRRVLQLVQQRVDQQYPGQYKITSDLSPDLPCVWADAHRVQQILNNLLENAVKYSPGGGPIEVIVSACPPTLLPPNGFRLNALEDVSDSRTVCITVRDRGIGIPHDQQIHLFKPFSRLEHSLTHDVPGAGLGLYITRKLAEAMGGSITLSSSEGEGTSVTFTLPIKPPSSAPVTAYVPMKAVTI